jgi:hypothetical protein
MGDKVTPISEIKEVELDQFLRAKLIARGFETIREKKEGDSMLSSRLPVPPLLTHIAHSPGRQRCVVDDGHAALLLHPHDAF